MTTDELRQIIPERYIFHYSVHNWGFYLRIMEKSGIAFARAYMYDNDKETICLDSLSVNEDHRKQGIGRELQEIRENIGIAMGAKKSFLWVIKNTWMREWYNRRGYVDSVPYKYDRSIKNAIWMAKDLTI